MKAYMHSSVQQHHSSPAEAWTRANPDVSLRLSSGY
uniref:Uncharacterized protein n=1 Tax=Anguilla anguilla TaxID=7936 RepID=A0A0E9SVZ8_ANGAN